MGGTNSSRAGFTLWLSAGWLSACGGEKPGDSGGGAPSTPQETALPTYPLPTVSLVAPGPTVEGPEVTVQIATTGFEFWVAPCDSGPFGWCDSGDTGRRPPPAPAKAAVPWWWSWLIPTADAHKPGEPPRGLAMVFVDSLEVAAGPTDTFVITLEPGTYDLMVELRWWDFDTFFPPVRVFSQVTVTGPADTAGGGTDSGAPDSGR